MKQGNRINLKIVKSTLVLFILLVNLNSFGQAHKLVFGFQYKPILPVNFFGANKINLTSDSTSFNSEINQKYGNVFGGIVRIGLNRFLAIETGLNYVSRSYSTAFNVPDSSISLKNDIKITSFQIPISLLVYIRLSEMFYMNVALGSSLSFFPSNVATLTESEDHPNTGFVVKGFRSSILQGTFDANVGFEIRTKKNGYFYVGASYQLPYKHIMSLKIEYDYKTNNADVLTTKLRGSFLTADFRYFFNENPEKKRKWDEQRLQYQEEQKRVKQIKQAEREARKKRNAQLD